MPLLIPNQNSSVLQNLPIEIVYLIIEFMDPHFRLRILKQKYSSKYIQRRLLGIPRTPSNIAKIFHCFQLMKHMVEYFNIKAFAEYSYQINYLSSLQLNELLQNLIIHNKRLVTYSELIENKKILEKRKQNPDKHHRGKTYRYFLNSDFSYAKNDIIYHKKWMDSSDSIKDYITLISRTISNFKKIYTINISETDKQNMELLLFKIYKYILLI